MKHLAGVAAKKHLVYLNDGGRTGMPLLLAPPILLPHVQAAVSSGVQVPGISWTHATGPPSAPRALGVMPGLAGVPLSDDVTLGGRRACRTSSIRNRCLSSVNLRPGLNVFIVTDYPPGLLQPLSRLW